MHSTCTSCKKSFYISEEDIAFYERISPTTNGTKIIIPPPSHCPECRFQRRLAYRNEYTYYSRACDLCKKSIVSVYDKQASFPVYCYKCWWSDLWDPMEFGRDFDFSRGFFEQFVELRNKVPQLAMMNDNGSGSENSEYCQDISRCKDCYLITGAWHNRECFYSTQVNYCQDAIDCLVVAVDCELVYESTFSQRLYNCSFLSRCVQCSNCHFGFDLRGCSDCIGCVGLRQQQYHIFNKPYSKEEFIFEAKKLRLDTFLGQTKMKEQFAEFALNFPHRAVFQTNCENCIGDSLYNCRNFVGFGMINAEHSKYTWLGDGALHCHDVMSTGGPQWCYEGLTPDNSHMTLFTTWCWKDRDVLYSDNCHSSANLFGCISLRHKQYCILNQQFKKEEYEALIPRIVKEMEVRNEWGEFIPMNLSPFAYNESRAMDIFPLSKKEVSAQKLRWKDPEHREFKPQSVMVADAICDVDPNIFEKILSCSACSKNFKLAKREFEIYQKMEIPIPRKCPDCRRKERFKNFPCDGRLYKRKCEKCSAEVLASYAPSAREIVYCESCYSSEIY